MQTRVQLIYLQRLRRSYKEWDIIGITKLSSAVYHKVTHIETIPHYYFKDEQERMENFIYPLAFTIDLMRYANLDGDINKPHTVRYELTIRSLSNPHKDTFAARHKVYDDISGIEKDLLKVFFKRNMFHRHNMGMYI